MVRELSPRSTIVVGGHVAAHSRHRADESTPTTSYAATALPGCALSWARIQRAPIRHPHIVSGFDVRAMGLKAPDPASDTGGHDHSLGRLSAGLQLLHDFGLLRRQRQVSEFLQDRQRTVRRDVRNGADDEGAFVLHDGREFSAAPPARHGIAGADEGGRQSVGDVCVLFGECDPQVQHEELVELGVSWIWMGLESPRAGYAKLQGHDTLALTRELRQHGIKLLGSTHCWIGAPYPREHRGRD